jgi:hypothetical protein
MSTLLLLAGENPWPALVVAVLNLTVGLFLVGVSLLLGITVSLLAFAHALANREPVALPNGAKRRAIA